MTLFSVFCNVLSFYAAIFSKFQDVYDHAHAAGADAKIVKSSDLNASRALVAVQTEGFLFFVYFYEISFRFFFVS